MKLYTIDTGYFKLDGGAMFGVVPKTIWEKKNPPDEWNRCTWAMRCLLIEDENRLILIDTGIGNKQHQDFFERFGKHGDASLEKSLTSKGFNFEDVTDVVLTHLHFDHVGGAVSIDRNNNYCLTFPNATYWSTHKHWQWAANPNPREKSSFLEENIKPIEDSGQLKFIAHDKDFGHDQISFYHAHGHTEDMLLPIISYKGYTIAYMADLLPSSFHLPLSFVMAFDVRPLNTMQEKEDFLEKAFQRQYILFLEHDPVVECCSLTKTDKGIRLKESFSLDVL